MSSVRPNDSPPDEAAPMTLQRGKACLRCRKRKMRCDGVKPACQQCVRAKKPEACEYDDGRGKTRTQILRETVQQLEQRVRELEDPDHNPAAASMPMYDMLGHERRWSGFTSESSSSSVDGSIRSGIGLSHSPFAEDVQNSPRGSWMGIPSPSPPPFQDSHVHSDLPPIELSQVLLDIFAPHRYQVGLSAPFGRLRDSVALGTPDRHPVLLNAIYLWSCFVSRPGPLSHHENHYLSRALEYLGEALQEQSRVIDVIQASCLLSLYFLANGRLLEGGYHVSAAASMCVQWGLHGGISNPPVLGLTENLPSFKLAPPTDSVQNGERILTFWQVYNLDRCWSVVLQRPPTIPDGQTASTSINTPWPIGIQDYESGLADDARCFQTMQTFFEGQGSNLVGGFAPLALRVKASALWEKAYMLSSTWDHRLTPSHVFTDEFQNIETTIKRFIPTLIAIQQFNIIPDESKHANIVNHTLAHAAMIQLYFQFGIQDSEAYDKCLRAAHSSIEVIKLTAEADYDLLDPIIGSCWGCVADVLIRELDHIETAWPLLSSGDLRNEMSLLLYALTTLSVRFSISAPQIIKLQKRLQGDSL